MIRSGDAAAGIGQGIPFLLWFSSRMTSDERIIQVVEQVSREVDPETAALFAFYARLLRRLAARKASLDLPAGLFDAATAAGRLRAGRPHLEFDRLALAPEGFGPWACEVRDLLAEHDPGLALEVQSLDGETAVALARAFFEQGVTGEGPAFDAVLANALAPWLEAAAEAILPRLPLARWRRTYCPVCGGAPDFAALEPREDQRTLLCERCRAEWRVAAGFCVFCGEDDPGQFGFYGTPDEAYRLEVCDSCGHYLKTIVRAAMPDALLAAERLLTPGLDLAAVEAGYTRRVGWAEDS